MHVFVAVRALHILVAAMWVGAGVFLTVFLMPTLRCLGAQGTPVLAGVMRRRMGVFMAAIGGLTVLTGLWLYWEFTRGLEVAVVQSGPGIVLALGGMLGIVAAVVGGVVIGRSVERITQLSVRMQGVMDEAQRKSCLEALGVLRRRLSLATKCDATLLVVALLLMSVAHYA